jgi:hypothetical protein
MVRCLCDVPPIRPLSQVSRRCILLFQLCVDVTAAVCTGRPLLLQVAEEEGEQAQKEVRLGPHTIYSSYTRIPC